MRGRNIGWGGAPWLFCSVRGRRGLPPRVDSAQHRAGCGRCVAVGQRWHGNCHRSAAGEKVLGMSVLTPN